MCYAMQPRCVSLSDISRRATRLAGLTVDLAGLRGVLWHRFGLGEGAEKGSLMSDEVLRLRGVEVRRGAAGPLRHLGWTPHPGRRVGLMRADRAGESPPPPGGPPPPVPPPGARRGARQRPR